MISLELEVPLSTFSLRVKTELRGRAIAVLGRSGAGKTTLLECIAGLRRGTGRIALGDRVLLETRASPRIELPPERRRVGYVPQDALLFPHLRVRENLQFGLDPRAHLDEVIDLLELRPLLERAPHTLSGGERMRVALGRALATMPELLLLDEPLAAVDVSLREKILPFLLRVRDLGVVPLIYVTHSIGEARLIADEVLVLERGVLQRQGPAAEVLSVSLQSALGRAAQWDNVLVGELERDVRGVRLRISSELSVWVAGPGDEAAGRATYVLAAEDVLVSTEPVRGISARNVISAEVVELGGDEDPVLVARAGAVTWNARVSRAAVDELALRVGQRVFLIAKAQSFRRVT